MLRTKKGFTLVELMVVIVIIGILAALAIPKFTNASAKAKWSEVPTVLASFENAELAYIAETGNTGAATDIVFDQPTSSKWFTYSDATTTDNGIYQGTVTGAASIGGIATNQGISTSIDVATSTITHSDVGGCQTAVDKMMPNFL